MTKVNLNEYKEYNGCEERKYRTHIDLDSFNSLINPYKSHQIPKEKINYLGSLFEDYEDTYTQTFGFSGSNAKKKKMKPNRTFNDIKEERKEEQQSSNENVKVKKNDKIKNNGNILGFNLNILISLLLLLFIL